MRIFSRGYIQFSFGMSVSTSYCISNSLCMGIFSTCNVTCSWNSLIIINTLSIIVENLCTITCCYCSALCRLHALSGHRSANAGLGCGVAIFIESHHLALGTGQLILLIGPKLICRPLGVVDLLHKVVVAVLLGKAHIGPLRGDNLAVLPVLGQIGGQGRRQRSIGWHIRFPPLR